MRGAVLVSPRKFLEIRLPLDLIKKVLTSEDGNISKSYYTQHSKQANKNVGVLGVKKFTIFFLNKVNILGRM